MTEAEWQKEVTEVATMMGWSWAHFRVSGRPSKAGPPLSGPLAKGWPDLFLCRARDKRFMWVELKSDEGVLSSWQWAVHEAMIESGLIVHVWRPRDYMEMVRELT